MSIQPGDLDHAIRMLRCTIHGYAMLQAANGFQWMIRFFDAGLTAGAAKTP